MSTCPGSGREVLKRNAWNVRGETSWFDTEGWRANCPECNKISALGPKNKTIQKHSPKKVAPYRQERLDLLYVYTYAKAREGETIRPNAGWPKKDLEIWLMAYLDGVGDSGADGRKIEALKRWLSSNGLGWLAATILTP